MIVKQEIDDVTWVDLESPTAEELQEVAEEFSIDPFVMAELQSPTIRPSVVSCDHYVYLILHFPAERHSHEKGSIQEIDIIVGKKFIVTVRYDVIDPVHKLHKILETEAIVDNEPALKNAGDLLYRIVMKMYAGVLHELNYQNDQMKEIENNIFEGREKAMVLEISKTSRVLRNFDLAIKTHREPLTSFVTPALALFGKDFERYIQALIAEQFRIQTAIHSSLETLSELRETNNSLLSTKQNEIMKVLTIMAFVTFPLTVITGIFGMNTSSTPIVGMPYDFWIILGIMVALTIGFFVYFLSKKWL